MSVADGRPRESGIDAAKHTPSHDPRDLYPYEDVFARPGMSRADLSSGSLTPSAQYGNSHMLSGMQTPTTRSTTSVPRSANSDNPYSDTAYPYSSRRQSRNLEDLDPSIGFDPNSIADDGDDGLHYGQPAKRGSAMSLAHNSDRHVGGGAGATRGGVLSSLGAMVGRRSNDYEAANASPPGPADNLNGEKSGTLARAASKKRRKMIILAIGALVLIGAVVGGIAGGVLSSNHGSSKTNSGQSGASDTAQNGDLNKDSAEIKALMGNSNLHKVFPGIDYTPMNTQYPDCLQNPPSQNNITRDLAVLSQLTNTIRLYGTDCDQTQMLMHSIDRLGMNDTVKVWLGVWQDTNSTTNTRQLEQLYKILDDYDESHFLGVIVGNEVLYRKDKTIAQMIEIISGVRSNITSRGMKLPVASADLGDNWTAEFASDVDYVMSNIHPFFAGTPAADAAAWTLDFWDTHDVPLTSDKSRHIIAETGWPSQGGTDCGGADSCDVGSVAGVDELNTFMNDWVCPALANGTNYFWFEAFDEPWKIRYDTAGKNWEDHWGLLTADRVLKKGVVVPDCGGKEVS